MPPKAQKKTQKKSKLEKAAETVISAGPFKLALAIGNDEEGKRALETLNGALKRARNEDIAESDSEEEVDEEEEERKRRNAAARKAKEVSEDDLWHQIVDEIAQDIFFVPPPEAEKPRETSTDECIIYYGKLLKSAALRCGQYWAKLTAHVESFCATVLREVKNIHAVSTVMKAKSEESQDWPAKLALLKKWTPFHSKLGLSLDHIVDMFSVGRLLNEYPRLQGFSSPEKLLNHVSGIRMRIQASASMASRFSVMINTVSPQKAVGVTLDETRAVQASVAERSKKRKARLAMLRAKKAAAKKAAAKKAAKKKTPVVVEEDHLAPDQLPVASIDADQTSSSESESEDDALAPVPGVSDQIPDGPTAADQASTTSEATTPENQAPKLTEQTAANQAPVPQPAPYTAILQKVPPLPPQTEEELQNLKERYFPDERVNQAPVPPLPPQTEDELKRLLFPEEDGDVEMRD